MRHTFKASFEQQADAQHLMEELIAAGYARAELALSGATHSGPFTRRRHAVTVVVDSEPEAQGVLDIMERYKPARLQDERDQQDDLARGSVEANAAIAVPIDGRLFGTQDPETRPTDTTFQETMGTASQWVGADEYTIRASATAPRPDKDVAKDDNECAAFQFGQRQATPDIGGATDSRSYCTSSHGRHEMGSNMQADPEVPHAGQRSVRTRLEDALHHGWDRITATMSHGSASPQAKDTVEADWENDHEHASLSTWHKVKDAVRHGWDRVRS